MVFKLFGPGLQRERAGSNRHKPRSFPSSRESSRASQHVLVRRGADPSRRCATSRRNHLQEEVDELHQARNQNGEQKAPRTKKKKKPPFTARAEQPAQLSSKTKQLSKKPTEPSRTRSSAEQLLCRSKKLPKASTLTQAKQDPTACRATTLCRSKKLTTQEQRKDLVLILLPPFPRSRRDS